MKEGGSVSLNSSLAELKYYDLIQWRFGYYEDTLIAEINKRANRFTVFDDVLDGRFRDRLKLDNQTGSLTITNITMKHAGDYKLQINGKIWIFRLIFCAEISEILVMEGDSVTLNPNLTETKDDDMIHWMIEYKNTVIVEISKRADRFTVYDEVLDGRYRDRLKLDNQTGSLTITNTTMKHAGRYELLTQYIWVQFYLTVIVSVTEGDPVTLNSGLTRISDYDVIQWRFGYKNTLIAEISKGVDTVYDEVLDERFRDRLKLDKQTGSLTITNITMKHAGDYKLQIKRSPFYVDMPFGGQTYIRLTVYARLPVPVISNSSHCSSSSSSSCSLVCSSVVKVSHVTLSWYKGTGLLSNISASDLSTSLSLPLDVEYQDKNTYSCVLNNPISRQTTHLNITQLCHTCADSVHWCGPTEAVIRLVLSALVGVATVLILVYDIRSRRAERGHIHTSGSA